MRMEGHEMINRIRGRALSAALAALGGVGSIPPGAADEARPAALEEIIVTATRRQETLNNVAVSVAAVGGAQADAMGRHSLASVVNQVPNVSFVPSAHGNQLTVRGVGSPALDNVQSS